ncbi:MAG: ribonuclease III domain-containing protein [Fusobacterium sp.]|uniref:ribonuclease III domain-containing protein n=1 Tax=Fusobacterium sp. TaxID=68766 RepID=UPI0026DAB49F|nr:ribonuclease III domain-containing protein [Fusobacterium sp.]MDO4689724.1 ribonuclease III domain-containing protein [Fusobacterium sp.]
MDNVEDIKKDIREYSGIELAYLGDAVWELEVRNYFIKQGYSILNLNKLVKSKVNAKSQSLFFKELFEELEEEEKNIARRAKNSNIKTFPKSCTVMEYKEATAFEAIIGALYLKNKRETILKILKKFIKGDEDGAI